MADEYIKREAAYDTLTEYYHHSTDTQHRALREAFSRVPAADVAPVVHGTNIGEEYADCDQFVCSNCGIELQDWTRVERDLDDGEITHYEYTFRYCPNCGAKMDGGDE